MSALYLSKVLVLVWLDVVVLSEVAVKKIIKKSAHAVCLA